MGITSIVLSGEGDETRMAIWTKLLEVKLWDCYIKFYTGMNHFIMNNPNPFLDGIYPTITGVIQTGKYVQPNNWYTLTNISPYCIYTT